MATQIGRVISQALVDGRVSREDVAAMARQANVDGRVSNNEKKELKRVLRNSEDTFEVGARADLQSLMGLQPTPAPVLPPTTAPVLQSTPDPVLPPTTDPVLPPTTDPVLPPVSGPVFLPGTYLLTPKPTDDDALGGLKIMSSGTVYFGGPSEEGHYWRQMSWEGENRVAYESISQGSAYRRVTFDLTTGLVTASSGEFHQRSGPYATEIQRAYLTPAMLQPA